MGSDLKPCPFCGVSNTHTANGWLDGRHNEEEWWQVECQECCAAGPSKPFEYQAAEAWNNAGAATARAEAAEQRAEALAAEVAQARAEGFASGIHAAAEVLARRADAMSASGHHGYAYEVREVRLVVLEVLDEGQPAAPGGDQ